MTEESCLANGLKCHHTQFMDVTAPVFVFE